MEHMEQLKKIRTDAISRIRTSPDFKLAGKLGLLIVELGDTVEDIVDFDDPEESPTETSTVSKVASVGSLATPLASVVATPRPFESAFSKPKTDDVADLTSDEMIEELVAEIEGDAAELDAIMAEQMAEEEPATLGPFLKPDAVESSYSNGATH